MDKKGIVVIKNNQIIASGIGLVIDFEYDILIEVEPYIAKQIEKFRYDGKSLKLKEGKELLNDEELEKEFENMLNEEPVIDE